MSINTPAAPGPLPDGPPHRQASPGAARDHVRRLHQDGRTYQAIATTAGLAPATVSGLATGRRRPTRGTTTAILAVTSATVPRGRVDAGGTRLRLRALHVMGHGSARIARALGVRETAISQLVRGDAAYELTHRPGFPEPVKLSPRCYRWWASEVLAFTADVRLRNTPSRRSREAGRAAHRPASPDDPAPLRITGTMRVARSRKAS
jgi:predicted DNA-binding transcriptional regulator AlpA